MTELRKKLELQVKANRDLRKKVLACKTYKELSSVMPFAQAQRLLESGLLQKGLDLSGFLRRLAWEELRNYSHR